MKEVTTVRAGQDAEIKLKFRNVASVRILVYRVDLMKLYLMKKNLNAITQIKAGETVAPDSTKAYGCNIKYGKPKKNKNKTQSDS